MACLISCDPIDDRLKIINNTNEEIFFSISKGELFNKNPLFISNKDTIWESSNIIYPMSNYNHALIGPNEWEYFINRDCEDSTLRIFFFRKELIIDYEWDSIVKFQIYSDKKSFKVKELEINNWEVTYDSKY